MHQKMADCLNSDKSIKDCHKEAMKDCIADCLECADICTLSSQFMIHGNTFFTGVRAEKSRGKDQFVIPYMLM